MSVRHPVRSESGQSALLVIGFCFMLFSIAGLAVDGARAWIVRRALHNAVDSAVVSAAGRLDTDAMYQGRGADASIDPKAARTEALRVLGESGSVEQAGVTVEPSGVTAFARASMRTTFLSLVGVDEIKVAAEASARPVFGEP